MTLCDTEKNEEDGSNIGKKVEKLYSLSYEGLGADDERWLVSGRVWPAIWCGREGGELISPVL